MAIVLPNKTETNVIGSYGVEDCYEDIEVVIKIPRCVYDDIQANKHLPNRSGIERAIANGIIKREATP